MLLCYQRIQLIATTEIIARALLRDKRWVPGRPVIWRRVTIGILNALSPLVGIRLQPRWALRRPRRYFFHLRGSSHPKPLRRRRTLIIFRRLCWNVPRRRSHEISSAALAASETPRVVTPSLWDLSKFAVEDNSPPPKSGVSRLEPRRSDRRNLSALKQSNFARGGYRLYPANQSQKGSLRDKSRQDLRAFFVNGEPDITRFLLKGDWRGKSKQDSCATQVWGKQDLQMRGKGKQDLHLSRGGEYRRP